MTEPCHGCETSPVDGRRVCECPPGKTGFNCDQDVNECLESKMLLPCAVKFSHGRVIYLLTALPSEVLCYGEAIHCLFFSTICGSVLGYRSPCEHGGTCVNTLGSFRCDCVQGFEGERCEQDIKECASNPCHNDATCLDYRGYYDCVCMPGKPRCGSILET